MADALNRSGLAVLRYDKRGVGGSSGDYETATTADFASDAEAGVSWLQTQSQIDSSRIGVLGHAEGGIIAPAVAGITMDARGRRAAYAAYRTFTAAAKAVPEEE